MDTFLKLVAAEEIDPPLLELPGSVSALFFQVHSEETLHVCSTSGLQQCGLRLQAGNL